MERRTWRKLLIGEGIVAVAIRAAVVFLQPERLLNDSADYHRLAVSLATGHGWGASHFAPGGGPTALRPPLYPLTLAAIYRVAGVHVRAGRLAGAVLGGAAVILLAVAIDAVWGRRVALVAGALACVLPPLVLASTSLMSEAIAVPLLAAFLAALFQYWKRGDLRLAVAAGAALGLLVLDRPSLAVLGVPLVILCARRRSAGRVDVRPAVATAVSLAVCIVVVAPWLIRDRLAMGHWVPLTTQGGYVLSGTYNATSAHDRHAPAAWRPANLDPADNAIFRTHPGADEITTNRLLEHAALHYALSHPAYVVEVAVTNTGRLFDLNSPALVRSETSSEYGVGSRWGDAEMAGALLLLLLAAGGSVVLVRSRRSGPAAWWVGALLLWVSTVVLQALPRFRAELDPFLLPCAAVALLEIAGRAGGRGRPRAISSRGGYVSPVLRGIGPERRKAGSWQARDCMNPRSSWMSERSTITGPSRRSPRNSKRSTGTTSG